MLKPYTVMFIGHRFIEEPFIVCQKIRELLEAVLKEQKCIDILIGDSGEFDKTAASCIKSFKREHDSDISLILVLPYYKSDMEYYEKFYDEVVICGESAAAHFKAAIQIRNRNMVDRSDLIVAYVEHNYGGAYETLKYAVGQKKKIINLSDTAPFQA